MHFVSFYLFPSWYTLRIYMKCGLSTLMKFVTLLSLFLYPLHTIMWRQMELFSPPKETIHIISFPANQQKAGINIYSLTQCSLSG